MLKALRLQRQHRLEKRPRRSKHALTPEEEAQLDANIDSVLRASRYRVRGEWEAGEVEPYLAPLRSSLDMTRVPNYSDERGLSLSESEEL